MERLSQHIPGKKEAEAPVLSSVRDIQKQAGGFPFKPSAVYSATVLRQEGANVTIRVNDLILNAEQIAGEKLPEKVLLKFLELTGNNEIRFQILQKGPSSSPNYTLDIDGKRFIESIRSFMPELSQEQLELFLKTLPIQEGNLFENLVLFKYLYDLNPEKVRERITSILSEKIDPGDFKKLLAELSLELGGEISKATDEEIVNSLVNILQSLDRMGQKLSSARNMKTFADGESESLKSALKTLINTLSNLQDEKASPAKGEARGGKAAHPALPEESVRLKTLNSPGEERSSKGESGEKSGALKELLTGRLHPDNIIEKIYRLPSEKWHNIFSWVSNDEKSFIRGLSIDEKSERDNERAAPDEYQVTFEMSFKNVGAIRTVLLFMGSALSLRMICAKREAFMRLQEKMNELETRLKERDINLNFFKIELEVNVH